MITSTTFRVALCLLPLLTPGAQAAEPLADRIDVFVEEGPYKNAHWGVLLADLESGAVCLPKKGEEVVGDGWLLGPSGDYRSVLVVDGLGHGRSARLTRPARR